MGKIIYGSAEIISVGTEILIGDIVNTNAQFISAQLAELGITQRFQCSVGDNAERLGNAIESALERCDLVIMTGGLGPTYDDLTKETAARIMGRKLVTDPVCLKEVKEHLKKFTSCKPTKNNLKQARIPEGSVVFRNSCGTAPGCCIEDKTAGKGIVMLPGPPTEMKQMWYSEVLPYLKKHTSNVIVSKNVNICGIGESTVENILSDLMKNSLNPTLAPYCGAGEVRVRVTAGGKSKKECIALCDNIIEEIRKTEVGPFIYGIDTTLEKEAVRRLRKKRMTVAAAESCTGGLFSAALTSVPGSSEVFEGSVISYSNRIKAEKLGVSEETLRKYGAVSPETASEMSKGVRKAMNSSIGVGITGIAGPGGGTDQKPVGLVYISVSSKKGTVTEKYLFGGNREKVRASAVSKAFKMVLDALN